MIYNIQKAVYSYLNSNIKSCKAFFVGAEKPKSSVNVLIGGASYKMLNTADGCKKVELTWNIEFSSNGQHNKALFDVIDEVCNVIELTKLSIPSMTVLASYVEKIECLTKTKRPESIWLIVWKAILYIERN